TLDVDHTDGALLPDYKESGTDFPAMLPIPEEDAKQLSNNTHSSNTTLVLSTSSNEINSPVSDQEAEKNILPPSPMLTSTSTSTNAQVLEPVKEEEEDLAANDNSQSQR
ncbi:hypothetical protein Ciccas_004165, partial [Cichlidogyrus casuarinus]